MLICLCTEFYLIPFFFFPKEDYDYDYYSQCMFTGVLQKNYMEVMRGFATDRQDKAGQGS